MLLENQFEIPEDEITISTSKSSGKGGQNVNTRETKVTVRWKFNESSSIDENQKKLIQSKLSSRINAEGEILVSNSNERTQIQNKKEAIRVLKNLITTALDPDTERVVSNVPWQQKEKRLKEKHRDSQQKALRQKIDPEDF